jgi:hypothetical protein
MNILTNGLTAGAIVVFCLLGVINSIRTIRCTPSPHWVHYWRILAGVATAFAFGYAFFDGVNGNPGNVPAELGRPAIIFMSAAFFISSYIDHERERCQ